MSPTELMEQADDLDRDGAEARHGEALRSYAELVAALEWLDHNGSSHAHVAYMGTGYKGMQAAHLLSAAKQLGWPGLETDAKRG